MENQRFMEEDANDFLQELINLGCLDDPAKGITKLVIDKGFNSLSIKQQYVFKEAIIQHYTDECYRCGNEIPWTEMSAAEHNGGLCSWCDQVGSKD